MVFSKILFLYKLYKYNKKRKQRPLNKPIIFNRKKKKNVKPLMKPRLKWHKIEPIFIHQL